MESAGAIAKTSTVDFVYTGSNTNYSVFDSLQYAVDNDIAPVISMSYGDCEADYDSSNIATMESLLEQANSQGQTVVLAAGDSGATAQGLTRSSIRDYVDRGGSKESLPASTGGPAN